MSLATRSVGISPKWSGTTFFIDSIVATVRSIAYLIQWTSVNMRKNDDMLEFIIPAAGSEFREHLQHAYQDVSKLQDLAHEGFEVVGHCDGILMLPLPVDDAIRSAKYVLAEWHAASEKWNPIPDSGRVKSLKHYCGYLETFSKDIDTRPTTGIRQDPVVLETCWQSPEGFVSVGDIMHDPRFMKKGKNPPRTTIQQWAKAHPPVPAAIKAADSQEVHYPEKWVLERIAKWNPRL